MFRYFRRHQKTFIIVGGVILMFVFTIGDSLTRWMGPTPTGESSRNPNEVVVSWDGGELTGQQLGTLLGRRQLLDQFVYNVASAAYLAAEEQGLADVPPRVQPVGLTRDLRTGSRWSEQQLEGDVVQTHILAEQARAQGIEISDDVIQIYIGDLGRGLLGSDVIAELASSSDPRRRGSQIDLIFDALREQLLAHAYITSLGGVLAAEMPINRWQEWRRANDRIVLEAAAIDPQELLIDVPEPTDEQLRTFYEEHKDRTPFPVTVAGVEMPSPQPGFRIPRRIAVQYLRANYDEFVERYAKEVTEEEIQQYYEENKILFTAAPDFDDLDLGSDTEEGGPDEGSNQPENGDAEETGEAASAPEESVPDEGAADEGAAEESNDTKPESTGEEAAESAPDTTQPDAEQPEATEEPATEDSESPAESESAEAAESEETPSNEAVEEPAAESTDVPTEEESAGDGAASPLASPFRLVAYQQDGDEPATDAEAADDATAEPAAEEPPPAEVSDSVTAEETPAATEPGSDAAATDLPASEEAPEVKYQPLEEVSDEIRRRIAEDRFFSEIDDAMSKIGVQLNREFASYFQKRLDAEDSGQKPPAPSDELTNLAPYAEEYKLEYEQTGELNQIELAETAVGESIEMQKYSAPVWQVLFGTDLDLYEPIQSGAMGRLGDRYLLMKTSDQPAKTPTFEEVKDQVAQAWKQAEAAKLALKKAEGIAENVRESGNSLEDFFADEPDVKVTLTNAFTYITAGDVAAMSGQPDYRLSQPDGIQHAGPQFMDEVFGLEEGEVAALLNFDGSQAYVVRVADEFEAHDQLRSRFLEEANFWPGRGEFWQANMQQLQQAVIGDMLKSMNVEWKEQDEPEAPPAAEDAE